MNSQYGLVPIRNFAELGNGIFRSAQPLYRYEYEWLKNVLGLNKIINLRKESEHDNVYAPSLDIEVIHIPIVDHHEPTLEVANQFINFSKEYS
jgi:hypothetical protein